VDRRRRRAFFIGVAAYCLGWCAALFLRKDIEPKTVVTPQGPVEGVKVDEKKTGIVDRVLDVLFPIQRLIGRVR